MNVHTLPLPIWRILEAQAGITTRGLQTNRVMNPYNQWAGFDSNTLFPIAQRSLRTITLQLSHGIMAFARGGVTSRPLSLPSQAGHRPQTRFEIALKRNNKHNHNVKKCYHTLLSSISWQKVAAKTLTELVLWQNKFHCAADLAQLSSSQHTPQRATKLLYPLRTRSLTLV